MIRILGIDPGTTTVGFAIIDKEKQDYNIIDFGVFSTTPKISINIKLLEIGNDIKEIIEKYKPDIISVEKLYFQNNAKTAIDVAQARGVVMYEAMKYNLDIQEYTPLQVKKAITGHGQAKKLQLQRALKIIFKLDKIPKPDDAADAIGLAYMGGLNS
ncbi:MAG: crossover junction endodeoxyribonuclease RuvC [Candidatus Gracilibacteria bacterium]|nr:crossover junction endodeoxyribonuclease RuvC [Candidatus Gracilibacteria bacterium]